MFRSGGHDDTGDGLWGQHSNQSLAQFFDEISKLVHRSILYEKTLPYRVGFVAAPVDVVMINDTLLMRKKVALLEIYPELVKFGPADQVYKMVPGLLFPQIRTGIEILESIATCSFTAMPFIQLFVQPLKRHHRILDSFFQERADHHFGLIGAKCVS